ncbi:NADPH-dependent FMN reductase [Kitasatospora sp. NPDC059571]|uniref:NADPH-dependent FMN reductase n=1 Tax=Kitasatospora sp. NPDC059571 TaxID=3346871 RepID=UPI00368E38AF
MARIVFISGSLRAQSLNTAAVATVRGLLEAAGADHTADQLQLGELPFYDFDVEQADSSEAVRDARALVASADAVVISTPSYNGQFPGVLKNALDWLSRPYGESALTGMPVAVLSASPGPRGGGDAQPVLVDVLRRSGARVVEHETVALGKAGDLLGEDGRYSDPEALAALESLLKAALAEAAAADAS